MEMAPSERLELPTPRFEVWCSIQLSYDGRRVLTLTFVNSIFITPRRKFSDGFAGIQLFAGLWTHTPSRLAMTSAPDC